MGLVADVIARLKTEVTGLSGRVAGAADLAEMMRRNRLPQVTPAAHVFSLGIAGGKQTALTGMYREDIAREVAVVLTIRSFDATGAAAIDQAEALIDAIVAAVAGWTPTPSLTGAFRLLRARLSNLSAGTLVYQIDFSLPDQLRITP